MGSRASAPHLFLFSIHEHHDVGARHWSDTLPFHIAGDIAHPGHDTIDITNVERHTTIMPNSSNNTVAILSSYYPHHIAILALNGTVVEDRNCNALSQAIGVSQYPCDTYVACITTPADTCV